MYTRNKYNFEQNYRKIYRRVYLYYTISRFRESNNLAIFAIKITNWTVCALFSKHVLLRVAFRRYQFPDRFNVDQKYKCVAEKSVY